VTTSRLVIGDEIDFSVAATEVVPVPHLWVFLVFGALVGLLGAAYNVLVMGALRVSDSLDSIPSEIRAMVIGAFVGTLLLVDPLAVGGGDQVVQDLFSGEKRTVIVLIGLLAVRLVAGPVSYAAGTPGGLFAPVLAVGALCGALASASLGSSIASFDGRLSTLIVAGMAAFFAAVVRSPITGIVLILEMTAETSATVPMAVAVFAAMLAASLVRSIPIYDTLRERSERMITPAARIE
jgi:CIC family chloride channel protein